MQLLVQKIIVTLPSWCRKLCHHAYAAACAVPRCGANHQCCDAQESRTYWFNAGSLEYEDAFMLVGLVLGLAIYNAVLLDFPLPLALYRKLLGQPAGLRDLADMDPTLGKSLRQLLDYEGAPANPVMWLTRGVRVIVQKFARPGRHGPHARQEPAPAAGLRGCACKLYHVTTNPSMWPACATWPTWTPRLARACASCWTTRVRPQILHHGMRVLLALQRLTEPGEVMSDHIDAKHVAAYLLCIRRPLQHERHVDK